MARLAAVARGDMRELAASDSPRARLAIDLMVYRIGRELGSMAAALGGLDALVFSGGIGENSVALRAAVCRDARWLGVEVDQAANAAPGAGLARISAPASAVSVWVVPANEELMIARHTLDILEGRDESGYPAGRMPRAEPDNRTDDSGLN